MGGCTTVAGRRAAKLLQRCIFPPTSGNMLFPHPPSRQDDGKHSRCGRVRYRVLAYIAICLSRVEHRPRSDGTGTSFVRQHLIPTTLKEINTLIIYPNTSNTSQHDIC